MFQCRREHIEAVFGNVRTVGSGSQECDRSDGRTAAYDAASGHFCGQDGDISFFEDGAVTSVLSENGKYKYSSRSRLFSEAGTLDFGTEVVRNVSGILQFHAASKSEFPITDVYYAGCPEDIFEVSRKPLMDMNLEVSRMPSVRKVTLPAKKTAADWIACIGAMLNHGKAFHDINLLSSYKKTSASEEKPAALWKHAILPASVFAACLLVYGGVQFLNMRTQKKTDKVIAWIESEETKKAHDEALALEQEKAALQQAISQTERLSRNRATYPKLDKSVVEKIQAAGGAGITSNISRYDAVTGEMTFEARSAAAIDIPSYIERLTQTNLFHSVNYTGYVFENNGYTLSLLCTMESAEQTEEGRK